MQAGQADSERMRPGMQLFHGRAMRLRDGGYQETRDIIMNAFKRAISDFAA